MARKENMSKKTERFIGKEERAYLDSKVVKKDPVFKKCDSCLQTFFEEQLARFGRHAGSPYMCKACADANFEQLKKRTGYGEEKKGIIE